MLALIKGSPSCLIAFRFAELRTQGLGLRRFATGQKNEGRWDNWEKAFATTVFTGVGFGVFSVVVDRWPKAANTRKVERIVNTFAKGAVSVNFGPSVGKKIITRPDLLAQLKGLLRPNSTNTYAVVVGFPGAGKTTALRQAACDVKANTVNGVVAFKMRNLLTFVKELDELVSGSESGLGLIADAIVKMSRPPAAKTLEDEWLELSPLLLEAASLFKKRYSGRLMTLVIDDVHQLSEIKPFLLQLQQFAMKAAQNNEIKVVFVSSTFVALSVMREHEWQRIHTEVVTVNGIDDNAAVKFLVDSRLWQQSDAELLVRDVTGGDGHYLQRFVLPQPIPKTVAELIHTSDTELEHILIDEIGMKPTDDLFVELNTVQRGGKGVLRSVAGELAHGKLDLLQTKNVLALQYDHQTYKLQGRHWAKFISRKIQADFEKQAAVSAAAEAQAEAADTTKVLEVQKVAPKSSWWWWWWW